VNQWQASSHPHSFFPPAFVLESQILKGPHVAIYPMLVYTSLQEIRPPPTQRSKSQNQQQVILDRNLLLRTCSEIRFAKSSSVDYQLWKVAETMLGTVINQKHSRLMLLYMKVLRNLADQSCLKVSGSESCKYIEYPTTCLATVSVSAPMLSLMDWCLGRRLRYACQEDASVLTQLPSSMVPSSILL